MWRFLFRAINCLLLWIYQDHKRETIENPSQIFLDMFFLVYIRFIFPFKDWSIRFIYLDLNKALTPSQISPLEKFFFSLFYLLVLCSWRVLFALKFGESTQASSFVTQYLITKVGKDWGFSILVCLKGWELIYHESGVTLALILRSKDWGFLHALW